MNASRRFSILLVLGLVSTLSIKTFVAASVIRPNNEDIAAAASAPLSGQGYDVAGLSSFSGRTALVAGQGGCIFYLVPVSEQGWHQETVRKGLSEGQNLSFLFKGRVYPEQQPRWGPLFSFYASLGLSYTGLGSGFDPVYAIVSSDECNLAKINWSVFPKIPYRQESVFNIGAPDDF